MYDNVEEERRTKQNINTVKYDIDVRNKRFMGNSTDAAKAIATEVNYLAGVAYTRSRIFQNFRKDNIVVKVEAVTQEDRISNWRAIEQLEKYCEKQGVEIAQLGSHRMFYIKNNPTKG